MLNKFIHRFFLYVFKKKELESVILRKYFFKKFNITIGLYSYGCFDTKRIPKNTIIGRYCSFAPSAFIFSRNHGLSYLSLHAYLYNSSLGLFKGEDRVKETVCIIEDDVWLGHNCVITPSVRKIGRGSVVAAGAVVTKNVPRYAIVAGNPAKVIRYRFTQEIIKLIEDSCWWLLNKKELKGLIEADDRFVYTPEKGKDLCKKK